MLTIKIYLDYRCFPVWIYNEKGELIDNNLPVELKEDKQVDDVLGEIQDTYDALFLDNGIKFKYIGFSKEIDKEKYLVKIKNATNLIREKVGNKYVVENNVKL